MTSVLDQVTNPDQATNQSSTQEPINTVDTLVGEGLRYSSVEELAKGKVEGDKFIEQLKAENEQMRSTLGELEDRVKESTTLESVVNALKPQSQEDNGNNQSSFNPEDIESLVSQTFEKREVQVKEKTNKDVVDNSLLEATGGDATKATELLKNKLEQIGMPVEQFSSLAKSSPDAALKLIDINKQPTKRDPSLTGLDNRNPDNPAPVGVRNKAYYDKLKRDMGAKKFFADFKLQAQMQDDFAKLGTGWYN